jgi:hypothetical protein
MAPEPGWELHIVNSPIEACASVVTRATRREAGGRQGTDGGDQMYGRVCVTARKPSCSRIGRLASDAIGVGGQFAAGSAASLVEVDAGAEGEDAGGDAGEQSGGDSAAVAFEQQLVFEAVDDRFDPLPDPADRRFGPVGLVGAAGSQEQCAQLVDGGFEVGAGAERLGGVAFQSSTSFGVSARQRSL